MEELLQVNIQELNRQMKKAAQDLNFEEAIRLRDEISKVKEI